MAIIKKFRIKSFKNTNSVIEFENVSLSYGTRQILENLKKGNSIALMIDQRVTEGIKINCFGDLASTTTIPAQLVKKFDIPVVPIFIERFGGVKFKMKIYKPIYFSKDLSIEHITQNLNEVLENMILNKPQYWIWSHNRWK